MKEALSPASTRLDEGLHCIDLIFQGRPGVIASYLIEEGDERALIETGPTSTLDHLLDSLEVLRVGPESISKLIVTHIHLDHAGAAGAFMHRFPQATLFVHELGAPHLINPEKLLASARRIYGDQMGPLWGEVVPVPAHRLVSLQDGNAVEVGSRKLAVVYTPGHASHHVAYHDTDRQILFSGDAAAVRLQGFQYVRPPTPPPELDLELWRESIERMMQLRPRFLNLTHFGMFADTERHLHEAATRLQDWAETVRRGLDAGQDVPEITEVLRKQADQELQAVTADPTAGDRYELATPMGMTVDGFLRYFRKRSRTAR